MRILMISDFYHPFAGGVEQHVRSLSAALVERGHDVAVATLGNESLPEFGLDGGVRVHRVQGSAQRIAQVFQNPGRPWAPPFPDPELTWALRKVVKNEQPDVVHSHDWLMRSFLPLKATSGARQVMTLHYYTLTCAKKFMMYQDEPCSGPGLLKCLRCGTQHYGLAKGLPVTIGNRLAAAHERRAVDMFLAVSHATAAGNGLVGSTVPYEVIPNFVPDAASGDMPHEALTPYLSQLPDDGYLLFVGDLRRVKGIEVLLRAYAKLEGVPPLVLIGKVWPESPTSLPPNVTVLRDWPNQAVMEAWKRSSIALVPSLWPEPFGIVVIEAMKSGRPVIASNTGGIPDIVADGETGVLVPPGDVTALAAAIRMLVDDPELARSMGQAGTRRVRQFQAASVVPRIERVYRDLVPGQPRSAKLALAR